MPDLIRVPSNANIFVDTNIFYYHFTGRSTSCTSLFTRIALGEVVGYVNTEVLSDLLHKLMLYEARQKNFINTCNASRMKEKLSNDRGLISRMPDYQNMPLSRMEYERKNGHGVSHKKETTEHGNGSHN